MHVPDSPTWCPDREAIDHNVTIVLVAAQPARLLSATAPGGIARSPSSRGHEYPSRHSAQRPQRMNLLRTPKALPGSPNRHFRG